MSIYERYAQLELEAREIAEQQQELRQEINKEVRRWVEPLQIDGLGRFVKVVKTKWTYSDNLEKERTIRENKIREIKNEIKLLERRAQILNRATSVEEYGFRFEVEK